jgi:uncharacterized protein (DUF2237 family)
MKSMSTRSALRGALFALVAAAVAVFGLQSPSMADESFMPACDDPGISCQTGVEVSAPQGQCETAPSDYASTRVCVVYDGDYIYVRDGKVDDLSAISFLQSENGSGRICRNTKGSGSWVRCNFDWAETGKHWLEGGYKTSSQGVHTASLWSWTGK